MSAVWCFIWNDSERLSKHLHRIILIYTTSYVNRQNPDRQDLLTFSSLLCDTLLYYISFFYVISSYRPINPVSHVKRKKERHISMRPVDPNAQPVFFVHSFLHVQESTIHLFPPK